jgi:hypothetical protein
MFSFLSFTDNFFFTMDKYIKKRSTVWQKEWLNQVDVNKDLISSWFDEPCSASDKQVRCRVCMKRLIFASHGVTVLTKHSSSASLFPLLRSLIRALLSLPHGNADAERIFSNLADIATDKGNRLGQHSTAALVVVRSYFKSHNLRCHTFPITRSLLLFVADAYATHKKRKDIKEKEKERLASLDKEKALRLSLTGEMAASVKLQHLTAEEEKVSSVRKYSVLYDFHFISPDYLRNMLCLYKWYLLFI